MTGPVPDTVSRGPLGRWAQARRLRRVARAEALDHAPQWQLLWYAFTQHRMALISLILVVLAYDEVHSCVAYLLRVWRRDRSVARMWRVFWGRPTPAAVAAPSRAPC